MKYVLREPGERTVSALGCWFSTFKAVYKASSVQILYYVLWMQCWLSAGSVWLSFPKFNKVVLEEIGRALNS